MTHEKQNISLETWYWYDSFVLLTPDFEQHHLIFDKFKGRRQIAFTTNGFVTRVVIALKPFSHWYSRTALAKTIQKKLEDGDEMTVLNM